MFAPLRRPEPVYLLVYSQLHSRSGLAGVFWGHLAGLGGAVLAPGRALPWALALPLPSAAPGSIPLTAFPSVQQCRQRGGRHFCLAGVWWEGWTWCHHRWTRQTAPGAGPGEMVPCGLAGMDLEAVGAVGGLGEQGSICGEGDGTAPVPTLRATAAGGWGWDYTPPEGRTKVPVQDLSAVTMDGPRGWQSCCMPAGPPHACWLLHHWPASDLPSPAELLKPWVPLT